jgi:hypothetical protein
LEKLNYLIGSYVGTIRAMFKLRLWTPYLLFAIFSVVVLWLLANPHLPLVGPVFAQIAKLTTGSDSVGHYPDLYVLLPKAYGWVTVFFSIFLEVLLIGAGFVMFSGYYRGSKTGFAAGLARAKSRYIQLVTVWMFYTIVFVLLLILLPRLFDPLIGGSPRRTLAFGIGLRFVGSLVLAVFMYVLPGILIDGERFGVAIRRSIRTFAGSMFSSYIIALVPYLIVLPFTIMLYNPYLIVTKFYPELVFYLVAGEIIANMFASFIFTSTVLRFHWEFGQ